MHSASSQEQQQGMSAVLIKRGNQLITTQNTQQETLIHIISFLNVTRYATQVNRQHINIVMDTVEQTHQDVTTLQLHKFTVQQFELPAGHTSYSLYSSKSLRFTALYDRCCHAYNGITYMQPQLEYSYLMHYQ